MAQHPPTPSAERLANGQLALTTVSAHEDEVRNVGARNEQHQSGRGGHHPECARNGRRLVFAKWNQHRAWLRLVQDHLPRYARRHHREQFGDS